MINSERADIFIDILKGNTDNEKIIQFVNIIESNNFNRGLSVNDIEGDKLKKLMAYFYDNYDATLQRLIVRKTREDISYSAHNLFEKSQSAFAKLDYDEKEKLRGIIFDSHPKSKIEQIEITDQSQNFKEFIEIFRHLNKTDCENFRTDVYLKINWVKEREISHEKQRMEREAENKNRVEKFEEIFDTLNEKEKWKIMTVGWLARKSTDISVSENVDYLLKELSTMPPGLKLQVYDSRIKNISIHSAIENTNINDPENKAALQFLNKLDSLTLTEKSVLVFEIMETPSRKDLKRPVIVSLLNEYHALNGVQQYAIQAKLIQEAVYLAQIKKLQQFEKYNGSFFDKIQFKLLRNKAVDKKAFTKLSGHDSQSPLMVRFNEFSVSDILIVSENILALEFLTKHNKNFRKPEVVERMLAVANAQGSEDIVSYIQKNLVEPENLSIPNKNAILGKLKQHESENAKTTQNLKVK